MLKLRLITKAMGLLILVDAEDFAILPFVFCCCSGGGVGEGVTWIFTANTIDSCSSFCTISKLLL